MPEKKSENTRLNEMLNCFFWFKDSMINDIQLKNSKVLIKESLQHFSWEKKLNTV